MKKILLHFLSLRSYIFLSRLRHSLKKSTYPVLNIPDVFGIISKKKKISFIQVGAYDGVSNDPISFFVKKYNWQGILVEPVPYIFEKLVANYAAIPGLQFENSGVSDKAGELNFYSLPEEYTEPEWLQQLGTFEKHSIAFNLAELPQLIPFITEQKIKSITLQDIIVKYSISQLDLICIDAEGFEFRILSLLPRLSLTPQMILFEYGSMQQTDNKLLCEMLLKMRYKLFTAGGDMIAIRNK